MARAVIAGDFWYSGQGRLVRNNKKWVCPAFFLQKCRREFLPGRISLREYVFVLTVSTCLKSSEYHTSSRGRQEGQPSTTTPDSLSVKLPQVVILNRVPYVEPGICITSVSLYNDVKARSFTPTSLYRGKRGCTNKLSEKTETITVCVTVHRYPVNSNFRGTHFELFANTCCLRCRNL